ncbi:MAG: hypothetical protein PHY82_07105 [Lentisphaeria bacterium]|nr:hypothetical protein [Lentisphaeria bacterium]
MKKMFLGLGLFLFCCVSVQAFNTSALQISIWAPKTQLVPDYIDVSGLKLNLPYGSNQNMAGLDLGLVSINGNTAALQVNLFNRSSENFAGLQVGLVNVAGTSGGISISLFNSTESIARGVDIALVNTALEHRGIQIGLVNYTEFLTGFQIGLINIVTKSTVPFFPIINFCF